MFLIDIYGLFFLFGLVKLISGYQNLKSTCPKGYQGFWNFASPGSAMAENLKPGPVSQSWPVMTIDLACHAISQEEETGE